MKNKVLIVTTVPETLESILRYQPKHLSKTFDVTIASSPSLGKVRENEGVICFDVPMHRGISPFKDIFSIIKLIRIIVCVKPDIVHSYTPKAGLVAMLAAYICRTPVRIHTFTGLIFPTCTGFKKKLLMFFDKFICLLATTIIPEGNGVRKDLIKYKITSKDLQVLGNGNIAGVDTHFFKKEHVSIEAANLRKSFSIPESAFVFCFVGRLTLEKGISELLAAFEQMNENTHLLLVGSQDARLPLPNDLFQKLNNHSRVHLTGFIDDIRPALAASNTLVLPSYREGFPNTPLQAGSMQIPCIVSNISGCNEIVANGINGWLVQPKCSHSLLLAMNKAITSNNLSEMGIQARALVKQKFEKEKYLQLLEEFYINKLNEVEIIKYD